MPLPAFLDLADEDAYRAHFENTYCQGPITTFDGIKVRFRKKDFDHCCFKSNRRTGKKEALCPLRAKRLDWIKFALEEENSTRFAGWIKADRVYDHSRRVCIICRNYVVVIALTGPNTGDFITAYLADSGTTIENIHRGPRWVSPF